MSSNFSFVENWGSFDTPFCWFGGVVASGRRDVNNQVRMVHFHGIFLCFFFNLK